MAGAAHNSATKTARIRIMEAPALREDISGRIWP
jgi:hypothetical protein